MFCGAGFEAIIFAWGMQILRRICSRIKGIGGGALSCPGCRREHSDVLKFMFRVGACAIVRGTDAAAVHHRARQANN